MFGQNHLASSSSLTNAVPQSGHTSGKTGLTASDGLSERSTSMILGMISPPLMIVTVSPTLMSICEIKS